MGNEGQPPQEGQQQQPYYGWQYDQDAPGPIAQQSPVVPTPYPGQPPSYPSQMPGGPPPVPPQHPVPPQQAPRFQQPVQDMGTSLGITQGMEFQYFNAPQPSQPLPVLRQQRLQQLREERMRRQQRRMKPDMKSLLAQRSKRASNIVVPPQVGPAQSWHPNQNIPRPQVPVEMSPLVAIPPAEMSPRRAANLPPIMPPGPPEPPDTANEALQPASQVSQDTGMIQRARIGRAALILTGSFIASRILGLLRTSMFAYVFGTSATSDAFLQAFLVPDLIFNIVAGGALSSAFIPVFTHYMIGERDEKTAWHVASAALNLAIAIMMVLAFLAIILAPWIVPLYNPDVHDPNEINLIISLSRIMFLQSILLGGGVIVTSILNAKQNFLQPAIGTVLYNVGLIGGLIPGIILVAHRTGVSETTAVYFATWGVVAGAFLQVVVQIPALIKTGLRYTFSLDYHHPGVIQIGRQMVPRIINSAMLYISIFVDRSLILLIAASIGITATNGYITQYYQALQLVLLPLGIFGMAISTAAFPTMAENVTRGRFDRVRNIIQDTLRTILFMSIPSSIGLIVLGLPIIQALLEHGAYSLQSAQNTAVPLAFFALGLAGLASVEILTRSFYAMRDSVTPVIISVAQFILKIALSLLFIQSAVFGIQWGLGALACATSIAGLLEAGALLWMLQQRIGGLELRVMATFAGKVMMASLVMGLGLLIVRFLLDIIINTTSAQALGFGGTIEAFIKLLIELAVGVIVYIRTTRILGIEDFWKQGPIKRVLERFRLSWL